MRHLVWRMLPIVLGGAFLLMALLSPPPVMVGAMPPLNITETSTAEPPTRTPTPTVEPTNTPTKTPTNTPVVPPTSTPTNTPVVPPTSTPTDTSVVPPTNTPTNTPVVPLTSTPTNTSVVPPTSTPTNTPVVPPTNTPVTPPTSTPVIPPTDTPTPAVPPDSPAAQPDLVLNKTVSPSVARVGDQVVYTLTLSNIGGAPAVDVAIDDPLPAFLRPIDVTASAGTVQTAGNRVTVAIPVISPGETVTITIRAELVSEPLPPDNRNVAVASSSSTEITTDNNTSSSTVLPPMPDLTLTKSVSPAVAQVGDQVVYTLTIGNIGGAPATDITLTDTLPQSLRLLGVTTTAGNTSSNGNQVTVTAPSLAPGETIVVQVTAQVVAPLVAPDNINTAKVQTSDGEITTDNNSGSAVLISSPAILPQTAGNAARPLLVLIGLALVSIGFGALLQRRSYR